MNQPMDIIILAGQSNAVGYGLGEASYQLKHMEDVYLLYDNQAEDYSLDENGKEYMAIYKPWKITVMEALNGYTGSLAMRFADAYIEEGFLQQAYEQTDIDFAVHIKPGCDHHPHGLVNNESVVAFILAHCQEGK